MRINSTHVDYIILVSHLSSVGRSDKCFYSLWDWTLIFSSKFVRVSIFNFLCYWRVDTYIYIYADLRNILSVIIFEDFFLSSKFRRQSSNQTDILIFRSGSLQLNLWHSFSVVVPSELVFYWGCWPHQKQAVSDWILPFFYQHYKL